MWSFIMPFVSFKCIKKSKPQFFFFLHIWRGSSLPSLYLCHVFVNLPISMLSLYLSAYICTPTPLHRQTVTRKTASQAPLKSAAGWPTRLYQNSRALQRKQLSLLRGPPANHILVNLVFHAYILLSSDWIWSEINDYLLTYLLEYMNSWLKLKTNWFIYTVLQYFLLVHTVTYSTCAYCTIKCTLYECKQSEHKACRLIFSFSAFQ